MEFETTQHSASTFLKSVLSQVYFAHLRTTSFGWRAGTFELDPSTNTRQWHWLMLFFTVCQPLLMQYFTRDLFHHKRFLTSTFYTSYLIVIVSYLIVWKQSQSIVVVVLSVGIRNNFQSLFLMLTKGIISYRRGCALQKHKSLTSYCFFLTGPYYILILSNLYL